MKMQSQMSRKVKRRTILVKIIFLRRRSSVESYAKTDNSQNQNKKLVVLVSNIPELSEESSLSDKGAVMPTGGIGKEVNLSFRILSPPQLEPAVDSLGAAGKGGVAVDSSLGRGGGGDSKSGGSGGGGGGGGGQMIRLFSFSGLGFLLSEPLSVVFSLLSFLFSLTW